MKYLKKFYIKDNLIDKDLYSKLFISDNSNIPNPSKYFILYVLFRIFFNSNIDFNQTEIEFNEIIDHHPILLNKLILRDYFKVRDILHLFKKEFEIKCGPNKIPLSILTPKGVAFKIDYLLKDVGQDMGYILDDVVKKLQLCSKDALIRILNYIETHNLYNIRFYTTDNKLKRASQENNLTEDKLIQILIGDIAILQQTKKMPKEEEDKYTLYLSKLLNNSLKPFKYFTDVHDLSGKTEKKDSKNPELGGMGELDLRVLNENRELCHIGEALILNSIDTEYTKTHLKKIFDYDANGLPVNFMIIYSKVKYFYPLWQKYMELVKKYNFEYPLADKIFYDLSEKLSKYAGIKLGLTKHLRDGRICKLYHFFIDFS